MLDIVILFGGAFQAKGTAFQAKGTACAKSGGGRELDTI